MKKTLVSLFAVLLLSAPFMPLTAQCNSEPIGVSHAREPIWVRGQRPPETNLTYFDVVYVKGRTLEEVRKKADNDVLQRRSNVAGGRYVHIEGTDQESSHKYRSSLEVQYKLEREYYEQCETDEYHLYWLVQIAKVPGLREFPPVPNRYLKERRHPTKRVILPPDDSWSIYLQPPPSRNPVATEIANVLRSKITVAEGTCRRGMRIQIESPQEPTCSRTSAGYTCRADVSLVVTQCDSGTQNTLRGVVRGIDRSSQRNAERQLMRDMAKMRFWEEWVNELESWRGQ